MLHAAQTESPEPAAPALDAFPPDTMTIRQIACDPEVMSDPRTVRKEIADPGSVRGAVGERIRRKLAARGIRALSSCTR